MKLEVRIVYTDYYIDKLHEFNSIAVSPSISLLKKIIIPNKTHGNSLLKWQRNKAAYFF